MNKKRIVIAIAALAMSLGIASPASAHRQRAATFTAHGSLVDLSPDTDPLDGARGYLYGRSGHRGTIVLLRVAGVDAKKGTRFGAHIHTGPCLEGDGGAAGPHTNPSGDPPSSETEIWLDFTTSRRGNGFAVSQTEFEVNSDNAQSLVIHAMPTGPDGGAGPRLACLPLIWQ